MPGSSKATKSELYVFVKNHLALLSVMAVAAVMCIVLFVLQMRSLT